MSYYFEFTMSFLYFCSWGKVEAWKHLTQINVLIMDGIGSEDLVSREKMSSVRSIFPHQVEFIPPLAYGSTIIDDLSLLQMSTRIHLEFSKKYGHLTNAYKKGEAFKIFRSLFKVKPNTFKSEPEVNEKKSENESKDEKEPKLEIDPETKLKLLLNVNQMIDDHYPLPLDGPMKLKYKDFVHSQDEYEEVNLDSPIFSIDCEMCLTTANKHELTKISVVDSNLKPVYESFVKPDNPITNYLTRFSGITAAMLQDVTTKLSDVQEALKKLLPKDSIWVGHSLGNDLRAMQMFHPYVIDTSVIYNISGDRRRKAKLKLLSHMFLGQEIQCAGDKGHDPREDADAAM